MAGLLRPVGAARNLANVPMVRCWRIDGQADLEVHTPAELAAATACLDGEGLA